MSPQEGGYNWGDHHEYERRNREHGEFDARLTNLEAMMAEVREDVKSLLAFRASWLALTGFVSAVVALIATWFAGVHR